MESDTLALFIPIIAIIMVFATVMLRVHYRHKERMVGHMSEAQMAELEQMSRLADILDQRVHVLERILDDEIPNWRDK